MTERTWTHSEIVSYPTSARPYCTFWKVLSDGTKVYSYSDIPTLPAAELGIDYTAVKKDMERFDKKKGGR